MQESKNNKEQIINNETTEREMLVFLCKYMHKLEDQITDVKVGLQKQIGDVRTDLQKQITDVRTDLQKQITDVRTDLQKQITDVRTDLQKQINDVKVSLQKQIRDVRTDLQKQINELEKQNKVIQTQNKNIQLMIENEIRPNISIIAEGHQNLYEKFNEATKVSQEDELVRIRVNIHETEIKNIKEHLNI